MEKDDLKERLKQEIEMEALTLERRVNTKKELASLEMPEDSYEQLMKRIQKKEQSKAKRCYFSKKTLVTVAMILVVISVAGLGVNGARLYVLNVTNQKLGSKSGIIADTDDIFYVELTEKEAYEKIEDDIGILALRLADKPKGMELEKVYIDAEMGEALMEFYYNDHILTIYENRQNSNATFNTQLDGETVGTIEIFHLGETINITEVNKGDGGVFYVVQLERGDAYYYITSDIELESFKNIICGIIFINA